MRRAVRGVKMRQVVDRWNVGAIFAFLTIKLLQFLKKIFPPKEDGWRRASRAYLSAEHGKFGFGSFGIKPLPDSAMIQSNDTAESLALRLAAFLKEYPLAYTTLHWGLLSVTLGRKKTCDILLAEYAPDGSALSFRPFLQGGANLPCDREREVLGLILDFYNATRNLPDRKRTRILRKTVLHHIRQHIRGKQEQTAVTQYAERVLSSVSVCIGSLDRENTFQDPEILRSLPLGCSPLQFHIRCDFPANDADIWVYCNHAAEDGEPVMAMLEELSKSWGRSRAVYYPESKYKTKPVRCSTEDPAYCHGAMYLDFSGFFAERARLTKAYDVDIPVLALLSWVVSTHPAFKRFKLTLPVTIDATAQQERSLGLIYIRPSKYHDGAAPESGFLNYLAVFNRLLDETRNRRSANYEMTQSFALLPPIVYRITLATLPKAMESILGTAGLSVIKRAPFVIGTLSDAARDCFVAFGNMHLATQGGGSVGAVSIKTKFESIERYEAALIEIFAHPHVFHAS